MRWTNMSEKEMIKAWAEEECSEDIIKKYLSMPESGEESYWNEYDKDSDILEYDFDTVMDLKKMLESEIKEDFYKDLILPLVVATLKEKKVIQVEAKSQEDSQSLQKEEEEFLIPDFVYMF